MINLDSKESVLKCLEDFSTLELSTEEKLKLCDDLIIACGKYNIDMGNILSLKLNGGLKMDKITELSLTGFKELLGGVIQNASTDWAKSAGEIKANEEKMSNLAEANKLLVNENTTLKSKIEMMQNTIDKTELERKTVVEAHKKLSDEITEIKAQSRFNERLESLSKTGIDVKSLSKENAEFIKNLDDTAFTTSLKVFSSSIKPKDDLVKASENQDINIPKDSEHKDTIGIIETGIRKYWS